jgi:cbb3-type cytochrome c oxidase subunit III
MNRNALAALFGIAATFAFAADAPSTAAKADPAKGKAIVDTVCAACHGADGNSAASANPSLAGQHAEYLYTQLSAFKKGERKNATMSGMVAALSDDDMHNVAAYFSEQKPKERAGTDKALIEAGQKLYRGGNVAKGIPACMACHGPNGAGIPVQYPRLAGQQQAYVVAQLANFKANTDRKNQPMHDIASKLSEADAKAVAEYIAGLR